MVLLMVVPFLIPVPPLKDTTPRRELAGPDSRFLELEGLEVHYLEAGSGEPTFLLLHGFGASTYTWREVLDPLGEIGRVIAYDRPAFGLTERPLDWVGQNPYSPSAQVDLVLDMIETLGLERVLLVGNSAGGTIALEVGLSHPDKIAGLILVDPAVYTGGGAPPMIRPLLQTPQLDHLGPLLARRIARDGDQFIRNAWHDPDRIPSEVFVGYRKPLQVQHWDRALWELTKVSRSAHLETKLDQVQVPVLVITGDDDRIVPTEESIRLAAELPDAMLAVIQSCGHLPQEECPEQFLNAVNEYLTWQKLNAGSAK